MSHSHSEENSANASCSDDSETEASDDSGEDLQQSSFIRMILRLLSGRRPSSQQEVMARTEELTVNLTEKSQPDTTLIDAHDIKSEIISSFQRLRVPVIDKVIKRQVSRAGLHRKELVGIHCRLLPNSNEVLTELPQRVFCGTFSEDGRVFVCASQDAVVRLFEWRNDCLHLFRTIHARDVGWSILDTAYSPDGNHLIYSSWSDYVHLCNIHGNHDTHKALEFNTLNHSFCIFSLMFSQDSKEILGGANDGCLYVYDLEKDKRIVRIEAHDEDLNAVNFADASSYIMYSGSDDGLIHVWDRRMLREDRPTPVGTFAGHSHGITYIDSKRDGRYLISNSKDQSIKLWDLRRFSSSEGIEATKRAVGRQRWDYRWQQAPRAVHCRQIKGDASIMTYRGHQVLNTLIRCRFSPPVTTAQQFIISGCSSGSVFIYDLLTGQVVKRLRGHEQCVRDVSWHPFENEIVSTSWDGNVLRWFYHNDADNDTSNEIEDFL